MARFQAYEDPTFQRAMRLIAAITNEYRAQVTTTFDHDYETGDIVRLNIPRWFGMTQVDKLVGTITVTGTDTFRINIDTSRFDPYVVPAPVPWYVDSYGSVTPVGEIATNWGGATQNTLPH
jgi:hypothetical protein